MLCASSLVRKDVDNNTAAVISMRCPIIHEGETASRNMLEVEDSLSASA